MRVNAALAFLFYADPQVTRENRAIGADHFFSSSWIVFFCHSIRGKHTGMDETQVGVTPVFMTVIIHRPLDLGCQGGLGVVIKPEHASVHFMSTFRGFDMAAALVECRVGCIETRRLLNHLYFWDPELEPVIAFAQGKLQTGLQLVQAVALDAAQLLGRAVILDVPEDARAEGFQPGFHS